MTATQIAAPSLRSGQALSPQSSQAETLGAFLSEVTGKWDRHPALVIKSSFRNRVTTYEQLGAMALRIRTGPSESELPVKPASPRPETRPLVA